MFVWFAQRVSPSLHLKHRFEMKKETQDSRPSAAVSAWPNDFQTKTRRVRPVLPTSGDLSRAALQAYPAREARRDRRNGTMGGS